MNNARRRTLIQMATLATLPTCSACWSAQADSAVGLLFEPMYPNSPSLKAAEINKPGHYVMKDDVIQRKLWGAGHTGPRGFMLMIHCGSVDVDLRGNTLGANFGMAGIALPVEINRQYHEKFPQTYGATSLDSRFVTIRNGVIDLARGDETSDGIEFSNFWSQPGNRTIARTDRRIEWRRTPPEGIQYVRNDYVFENLKVLVNGGVALAAEGSHTVIRNCVIESAGNAAIFIAGPNVTIENCDIRLHDLVKHGSSAHRPTRAAIVLRDGSNAVIRNNRIRAAYGGEASETHCILVRDGANNVLIEGNTFIDINGEAVTLTEDSQAIIRNNRSKESSWF